MLKSPDPLAILKEAVKQVPALKYAIAVLGIVSVLVIVKMFQINAGTAWFGVIGVTVLMVLLFVFAKVVASPSTTVKGPVVFLIWSFLFLAVASAFLIVASLFFGWPRPFEDLIRGITGSTADAALVEINDIPKKDFSTVIEVPAQALILHLAGMPFSQLELTFHNPYRGTLKLRHVALNFTGPNNTTFKLVPEAIILANNVWNPPLDAIELRPGDTLTWGYSFFGGYPAEFQILLQKANAELIQKPAIVSVPDPHAQNLSAETTKSFVDYMNKGFKWPAGPWRLDISANYGKEGRIDEFFSFSLTQADVDAMKAISKYYCSGIGIIWTFRFLPILDANPAKLINLTPD